MEDWKDHKLISGIQNLICDDVPAGKNNNFDACVRHLLPAYPINSLHKKHGHSNNNEGDMDISV